MHPDIYPYQAAGAEFLADHWSPNAIIADEMGLGKSLQSIAAADLVGATKILVLCPGIARANWVREFEKWQTRRRTVKALYSSKDSVTTDVTVCSYSLLPQKKALVKLLAHQWDVIIADEAHSLAHRDAARTRVAYGRYCNGAGGLKARAKRFWLLTGTLIPSNLSETWTHCNALFPEAFSEYRRYQDWLDHFTRTRDTDYGTVVCGSRNIPEFVQRIKPYVLRRTVAQVLPDMPSVRVDTVLVEPDKLPPKPIEIVEVEKVLAAALAASANGDSEEAKAALAAAKEMHIASLRKWTGIAKAPAVAQQICTDIENGLDKIVIFAVHTEVINILHKAIPGSAVIDGSTPVKLRDELIDIFQGRKSAIPLSASRLIIQLSIGSTALTLTAACHCAFAETNWVPKDISQAIGRLRRIGQTRNVIARIFTLKGSVDEQISATLARKTRDISVIDSGLAS